MPDKKNLQELFFEPVVSVFKAISEDENIIKSKEHRTISFGNKFLGIKKTDFIDDSEIFLIRHQECFDLASLLCKSITQNESQLINYFHSNELDWVAFLFGSKSHIPKQSEELFSTETILPDNIEVVIGVNSGYNGTDIPNFYLVLRHKSEYRNSFLTIDNYKFTREDIEKYIKSGKDAKVLEDVVLRVISKKFQEQLKAFVELYSTLDTMTVDKKYFVPVCLDLFNRNRSITSMTNDPNLYKRVENIIKQGNDFIQRNETQIRCTRFIDFIIRFNYFPIDDLDLHRDKVEELFVQKRPYQKIEDIFPRFKKSQTSFKDYLNDQESSFDKINEVFRFI